MDDDLLNAIIGFVVAVAVLFAIWQLIIRVILEI
jgi:hypothetical protein